MVASCLAVGGTLGDARRRPKPGVARPGVLASGQVEVERVEQLDGRVRRVHLHVGRGREERLRVVEDDLHARADERVGRALGGIGRNREDADDDVPLADELVERVERA